MFVFGSLKEQSLKLRTRIRGLPESAVPGCLYQIQGIGLKLPGQNDRYLCSWVYFYVHNLFVS